ncbi:MAG: carbamoyl phosphate synthase small subunit, partial [Halobacteriovoraceae bacterium]|nr:carbamoyl phosphate synthase small subunit [Halobacteriovoraceae bacterium]
MTTNEQLFLESLEKTPGFLHFEDGTSFSGTLNLETSDPRLEKGIWGEAAFTTGMTGYQETMTDPSFLGQHIIFSSPHIGNYPSNERVNQSQNCHGTSIIAKSFSPNKFLMECETPLFTCDDTRALVKFITKKKGNHKSVITTSSLTPSPSEFEKEELICNNLDLVSSKSSSTVINPGNNPIVLIDYGCKQAIINNLKDLGFPLVILGHKAKASEVLDFKPRMIFLSNGPGDPRAYTAQIEEVKKLLGSQVPIRGICLGHQLITLALEASIIKLPFGQRGVNHPCIEHETGKVVITSQNHGYAASKAELTKKFPSKNNILGRELFISYTSLFDNSVEGISSSDHFLKTVQFHPEAYPGTHDGDGFFKEIKSYLTNKSNPVDTSKLEKVVNLSAGYKKDVPYSKVLIIGSGPIKIGQASEFDYSGTQACKVLMALGIEVVLLNSNPATIMTDSEMASKTYLEPITKETLKKIVEKEGVQAVLSTLGGQTALNLCIDLEEEGYFKENNIALLGANTDTIRKTEDRELFAKELATLGYHTGERYSAYSQEECLKLAHDEVGFPLII